LSLKRDNSSAINKLLIAHSAAILLLLEGEVPDSIIGSEGLIAAIVGALFAGVLTSFLNDVIGAPTKEFVVFWRLQKRVPSYRVGKLASLQRQSRIDWERLTDRYGEIPPDGKASYDHLYGIYRNHDKSESVRNALRSYLLFREAAFVTIVFFIIASSISVFYIKFIYLSSVNLMLYLVFVLFCRICAVRFIESVLAEASFKAISPKASAL